MTNVFSPIVSFLILFFLYNMPLTLNVGGIQRRDPSLEMRRGPEERWKRRLRVRSLCQLHGKIWGEGVNFYEDLIHPSGGVHCCLASSKKGRSHDTKFMGGWSSYYWGGSWEVQAYDRANLSTDGEGEMVKITFLSLVNVSGRPGPTTAKWTVL